ncbi:hypothetical protein IF1G_02529 [Cordyceps javanica]|uniref:Uncharacterized protein n=1 Tax=Cordyceps javanica TaxID=43265 RepID=A0A545VA32_9HYPO|nr:hypothetical protein IF1G_02529 [Cordyceps javanica]
MTPILVAFKLIRHIENLHLLYHLPIPPHPVSSPVASSHHVNRKHHHQRHHHRTPFGFITLRSVSASGWFSIYMPLVPEIVSVPPITRFTLTNCLHRLCICTSRIPHARSPSARVSSLSVFLSCVEPSCASRSFHRSRLCKPPRCSFWRPRPG